MDLNMQKEETRYNKDLCRLLNVLFIYQQIILHITSKYITVHITIYHYKPWFTDHIHSSKHIHSGVGN